MNEAVKMIGVFVMLSVGCGPSITTRVRYDSKPFSDAEYRQQKDGVTVENRALKELPPTFYAKAQACTPQGIPAVDGAGQPVMQRVSISQPGQIWYQVAITNGTGHVIRLNSVVIRQFDPAGNQAEPIGKEDLLSTFMANRPCPSTQQAAAQFRMIKMLDRNTEILPDSTVTGWLAFQPSTWPIPGVWKLAVYEVPVATSDAGAVTKTTRFELREVVKKYVDTFQQDSPFAERRLLKTTESDD
jgi:hypothetical protein